MGDCLVVLQATKPSNQVKQHEKMTSSNLGIHGKDAERAFSSLKWVKDERQRGMHEESHIAAVLLHFQWCGTLIDEI